MLFGVRQRKNIFFYQKTRFLSDEKKTNSKALAAIKLNFILIRFGSEKVPQMRSKRARRREKKTILWRFIDYLWLVRLVYSSYGNS